MVAPNSIGITRRLVRELTAEQGIDAYHGAQWRTRIAERLTAETEYGGATELRAEEGVVGTEVLTNAGDMIVFDRKRRRSLCVFFRSLKEAAQRCVSTRRRDAPTAPRAVSLPCRPSLLLATVPTACGDSCSALQTPGSPPSSTTERSTCRTSSTRPPSHQPSSMPCHQACGRWSTGAVASWPSTATHRSGCTEFDENPPPTVRLCDCR